MSEYPNVEPTNGDPSDGIPPEWPYAAPPQTPDSDEPPIGPLPLGEAIRHLPDQYIRVLKNPGATVFAHEQGKAAWNITWVQVMLASVVAALSALVSFNTTFPASLANSNVSEQMVQQFRAFSGVFALSYIVLMPIFFFVGVGFYHLLARAFGGRGLYLTYCYCSLLYTVPIGIISGVLISIIGLLGLPSPISSLLGVAASVYSLVLQIFVTMAVHRLSGGKATLAVLLVPIILFVLVFVLSLVASFFLFALLSHSS